MHIAFFLYTMLIHWNNTIIYYFFDAMGIVLKKIENNMTLYFLEKIDFQSAK